MKFALDMLNTLVCVCVCVPKYIPQEQIHICMLQQKVIFKVLTGLWLKHPKMILPFHQIHLNISKLF